jgi:hypothetical protein
MEFLAGPARKGKSRLVSIVVSTRVNCLAPGTTFRPPSRFVPEFQLP